MERCIDLARTSLKATEKEEAIAGIQEAYIGTGEGQDEWYVFPGNIGEVVRPLWEALTADASVVEAGEGLG